MTNHSRTTLFSVPNATSKDFLEIMTSWKEDDLCVKSVEKPSTDVGRGQCA